MDIRKTELDYDSRNKPKTNRHCVKCQRDIKPSSQARMIRVIDGGCNILHPVDEHKYVPDSGDMGWHLIGMDCARKIGLEWSIG